jgi:GNAT superfamily N-acetyltransferase
MFSIIQANNDEKLYRRFFKIYKNCAATAIELYWLQTYNIVSVLQTRFTVFSYRYTSNYILGLHSRIHMIINGVEIRIATIDDVPLILEFVRALAEYEHLSHEVVATEALLRETLFGIRPGSTDVLESFRGTAEVVITYTDSFPSGFALFFHNFSTFLGKPGIYLEDLFVKPEFRGKSIGKSLLIYLARLAIERNCGRLEWSVLDWNTPAIDFYKSLNAQAMDEWTMHRLTGETLTQLAEQSR